MGALRYWATFLVDVDKRPIFVIESAVLPSKQPCNQGYGNLESLPVC